MVFIWGLGLFSNPRPDYLALAPVCSPRVGRGRWNGWRGGVLETVICFVLYRLCVSPRLWDLRATFSLFSLGRTHLNCLGLRGFLLIYLHRLVELLLDHFGPRGWLDVLQGDGRWLFGGSLRVQSLSLLVVVTLVG